MPDDRVRTTGVVDVSAQARIVDRRQHRAVVTEADVVGEGAGEHARHLSHIGHLAGAEELLRVGDLDVVPPHRAGVVDQARE